MKTINYFLISSGIFCLPAWADSTPARPSVAMGQVLLGLLLVVGTILALAWLSRRLGGVLPGNGKLMKIMAVLPLGAREKLVLVEVGGQQLMLGVTSGQINTLHLLAQPVAMGEPSGTGASSKNLAARSAGEFSKKLQEFLQQGNKT